jgi:hypothetical protein
MMLSSQLQLSLSETRLNRHCPRCGGLMVPESFLELDVQSSEVASARCVQCGDIVVREPVARSWPGRDQARRPPLAAVTPVPAFHTRVYYRIMRREVR